MSVISPSALAQKPLAALDQLYSQFLSTSTVKLRTVDILFFQCLSKDQGHYCQQFGGLFRNFIGPSTRRWLPGVEKDSFPGTHSLAIVDVR